MSGRNNTVVPSQNQAMFQTFGSLGDPGVVFECFDTVTGQLTLSSRYLRHNCIPVSLHKSLLSGGERV